MKEFSLAIFNTQPPHLYFGGVERRIIETARLLQNDVDMTVYSGTKAGFTKPATISGLNLVPCFSTDFAFPVDNWFFNRTLSSAVDSIKADVYEAHAVSGYGFLQSLRKTGSRKPFIQTVHGVLADEYLQALRSRSLSLRGRLTNLFMGQLGNFEAESAADADLVVTVSEYSAGRTVQLYGVDKAKIRVVPNGVDIQRFRPAGNSGETKRRLGIGNRRCVLFVGRLIPRKGLGFLVEAAEVIRRQEPETVFLIVGDGPLKNSLISSLKRLDLLGNFLFLGDVSEAWLSSLYSCADVFVLPSIQEGLGIALLEAQAAGKPVVAFNQSGVREAALNGKTGLLVRRDGNELAAAILRLLSDSTLREKMGVAGRRFVADNFSWEICAERMLRVYREAAEFAK